MSRFRVGFAFVAVMAAMVAVPVVSSVGAGVAAAAPVAGGDIATVCGPSGTPGTTYTLTRNCGDVTSAVTIPPTITTVNGAGHTISANATDAAGGPYTGAVLTNATAGQTMNIENLTIAGPTDGFTFTIPANTCSSYFPGLFGIFFNDASGSVTGATVLNMFQTRTPQSPACIVGHSIRVDGVTAPRTVDITNAHLSQYQRGGMFASGSATVNISDSTIGPGSSVPFSIAQNAVQWSNCCTQHPSPSPPPSGKITNSTIIGTSFLSTGPANPADAASTAILLYGAHNVTVDHNTIEGSSDIGISVTADTTGATISFNKINRPTPPNPDTFGIGVNVDPSEATLICNTWSGWHTDLVGALQPSCSLPDPECGTAYSAQLTVKGGTDPFDWSASGTLPPGLHLASTGIISGTPTETGTFHFTAKVTDSSTPPMTATQAQTITVTGTCGEEAGENPATPEPNEPGEAGPAPTAPITPVTVPVTG
jgi:hypothetical protein